jgi:hypothetical protein
LLRTTSGRASSAAAKASPADATFAPRLAATPRYAAERFAVVTAAATLSGRCQVMSRTVCAPLARMARSKRAA